MGVKINVGYCQKIGLPNYGSEGAHCNLELEVDSGLLNNMEAFQRRVQETDDCDGSNGSILERIA